MLFFLEFAEALATAVRRKEEREVLVHGLKELQLNLVKELWVRMSRAELRARAAGQRGTQAQRKGRALRTAFETAVLASALIETSSSAPLRRYLS